MADAYSASAKVILPLLAQGLHTLVTRVRRNAVAYRPAPVPRRRRRSRPRRYGRKLRLASRLQRESGFETAPPPSPVYGEQNVRIAYRSEDLLWRPVGPLVRFVFVRHPQRGDLILLCTDTPLDPLRVIALCGYRFKIVVGFRQAIHGLGAYAYHFWMAKMCRRPRSSGTQDIRKRCARRCRNFSRIPPRPATS